MRMLASLVLLTSLGLPAGASGATFSAPAPLSQPSDGGQAPVVAVAPTGAAVAAFGLVNSAGAPDPVQAALRPANGSFGPATVLGDPANARRSPSAAMDAAGDAVVAWDETVGGNAVVRVAAAPAGMGFGAAVTLSDAGRYASAPSLAMDDAGDALVAWSYSSGATGVAYAVRTGTGAFGPAQTLTAPGVSVGLPRTAMNARGDAVIAFEQDDTTTSHRIMASRRPAGTAAPTAPVAVTPMGQISQKDDAGVDGTGNATVVYQVPGGGCPPCQSSMRAVTVSASGTKGSEQTVGVASGVTTFPQVAVDGAGDAALAWVGGASNTEVQLATAVPAGTFGSPVTLDTAGEYGVAVGGSPGGDLLLAWPHTVGSSTVLRYASRAGATGTLSAATDLAGSVPFFGDAALASPDDAVLAWLDIGGPSRIEASTTRAGSTASVSPTPSPTATAAPTAAPAAPTATPAAGPTVTTAPAPSLHVSLKAVTPLRRRALKVRCTLTRAGVCTVKAVYRRKTVATGKATFKAAGTRTVRLKLSRAGRRALGRHGKVKLRVTAKATSGSSAAAAPALTLRLK